MPPLASSVTPVYGAFTVPLGNVGPVDIVGPAMMFREKASVVEPPRLSVTCTVKLNGPDAVGVPLITPDDMFGDKPGGRDDPVARDHVNPLLLPPEAMRVVEYCAPASPCGRVGGVVMLIAGLIVMLKG